MPLRHRHTRASSREHVGPCWDESIPAVSSQLQSQYTFLEETTCKLVHLQYVCSTGSARMQPPLSQLYWMMLKPGT